MSRRTGLPYLIQPAPEENIPFTYRPKLNKMPRFELSSKKSFINEIKTYKVRHEETDEALVKGIKDCDPERGGNINLQENSSVSLLFSNQIQKM